MKIIIDSRMRVEEKEYLKNIGEIIEITPEKNVYEEISAHPDIFICKIKNKIIISQNWKNKMNIENIEYGESYVSYKYPEDIKYNVCQIGNNVIHNFKYTDKKVMKIIDEFNLNKIHVNQGYSNCSISVISENACITSDKRDL